MTEPREVRRILVALDASPHSRAALKAAAKLAADLNAELLGLFVEDINLLRLAELPGAEEVVAALGSARALDTSRLERALRVQAAELQRAVESVAAGTNVRWTFRVARGQVVDEVLAAAQEVDMLILGKIGRSLARRARLGSTARAMTTTAKTAVVLLEHGTHIGQPVTVIFDGTEVGFRTLATAARLTRENGVNLIVLIPSDNANTCEQLQKQVADWLREHGRTARVHCFAATTRLASLTHILQLAGARTLVIAADHPLAQEKTLPDLLNQIKCPVVLVR